VADAAHGPKGLEVNLVGMATTLVALAAVVAVVVVVMATTRVDLDMARPQVLPKLTLANRVAMATVLLGITRRKDRMVQPKAL